MCLKYNSSPPPATSKIESKVTGSHRWDRRPGGLFIAHEPGSRVAFNPFDLRLGFFAETSPGRPTMKHANS
ncbi:hypothetical protein FRUB_08607 [Fimbriiglobus ruber]|uniref:Uncharacterized protein n=1 Tax=Fimbriiglobus ruber TaxID=1908690 RepID=A0A225D8S4_9BACT|nr:hypothetical protein FRUB_08607 [Fimbriiglobus ruber]